MGEAAGSHTELYVVVGMTLPPCAVLELCGIWTRCAQQPVVLGGGGAHGSRPLPRPPHRNQISVLNIEKDTLQFNVSRMVEDKDKMATQVDTDHDEMDRRTAEMLM